MSIRISAVPNKQWTLLSNHARVLIQVSQKPDALLSELSSLLGISLRAVQGIVADLERDEFIVVVKNGRRNHYRIKEHAHFRHPLESDHEVEQLLEIFRNDNAN